MTLAPELRGPVLGDVVENYRNTQYPGLAVGTKVHYDQLLALHFGGIIHTPVREITPRAVDQWIASLKREVGTRPQSKLRKSFKKELTLLGILLRHYEEYFEDANYQFPIKRRHRKDALIMRDIGKKDRDLPYEDFLRVLAAARTMKQGDVLAALMTVQYRQAQRISETCALHWEDVRLDFRNPENSTIRVSRHMEWSRKKGMKTSVAMGYKNSRAAGAVREQPMFPETYEALKSLFYVGARGLIFKNRSGGFFTYRQVQDLYTQAFARAGVPFTGTHSLRHGGCRLVYNETGDTALAGQILGNEDSETVKTYARRDRRALRQLAERHWQKHRAESELHKIAQT